MEAPHDLHLQDTHKSVEDDELLIRLNATGLCMSDVHFMLEDWAMPRLSDFGVKCGGHEGAGVVVKVGANCGSSWKVGDRVGIKPLLDVCHNCEQCWNGRENYCAKGIYTGLMAAGTYQQYVTSPAIYTTRIPDGVPDEVAAPIMCSASTMHRSLIESGLRPSDWVVFPGGGGGVGIQGVQLAKYVPTQDACNFSANNSTGLWECGQLLLMVVKLSGSCV